jgi:hypothetical protein
MKAIYIIFVLLLLLPIISSAAPKNTRSDIRKFKTELNLSPQQLNQLDAIYSNLKAQVKLQAPQLTREQKVKMRVDRRKKLNADIAKVLNDQQKTQLKAILQANKAKK